MKTLFIFLWIVCLTFKTYSQDINEYGEIDRIALNIPDKNVISTVDLADYINKHFDTDNKKVRAIYIWVISHIKYSTDSIHRIILNEDHEQLVTFAFRRRKGVCENFAAIFDDICKKCGLSSFVVEGYTKQNGSVDKTSHAWCTVFIDNKWSLYDPTWDAGQASLNPPVNTIYFIASPSVFIQSHMPFDPMFQLLNNPLTYKEFNSGNTNKGNSAYFNYADSLSVYEKMDPLDKYLSVSDRIKKNGIPNAMINTRLSQLRLEIEIIYQANDSALYNGAIADYNKAINSFNNFLAYRNNQFKPEKTDAEIQSIVDDIERRIAAARIKLKGVNQSKATLTLDTGDIEYAINNLETRLNEQKVFLKNYAGASKGN